MLFISKEVFWYLEDGFGCVYIVGVWNVVGMEFMVVSEVFEELGWLFVCGMLDYL